VLLVSGDAGVGKTRLAAVAADEVVGAGGGVLVGGCDPITPAPYRPFLELLGTLAATRTPEALAAEVGAAARQLVTFVPELASAAAGLAGGVEGAAERYRLFDAVDRWLAAASEDRPLLAIVDDAHWADSDSLALLRHLGTSRAPARLLLVVSYRPADAPDELVSTVGALGRAGAVRCELGALGVDALAEVVRRDAPDTPPQIAGAVAADLHELTGGNGHLLAELWRSLLEDGVVVVEGGELRVARPVLEQRTPAAVRDLARVRLARLTPRTRDVLEQAAVAGPDIDLALLVIATGRSLAEAGAAVDDAAAAGFLEVGDDHRAARFVHELVRRGIYDRLPPLRRATLHRLAADALLGEGVPAVSWAAVAHHLEAAGPRAPVGDAARAHEAAAADAARSMAFADAASHLRRALALAPPDPRQRAEWLVALGDALVRAGADGDALEVYERAAGEARAAGAPRLLAAAAIGFEGAAARPGASSTRVAELLRKADRALPVGDDALRAAILAGLARTTGLAGDNATAWRWSAEAIAMARRIGDARVLAGALASAYHARGTITDAAVVDLLREARDVATAANDDERALEARSHEVVVLVASGRLAEARRELEEHASLVAASRQPYYLFVHETDRCTVSLAHGELAAAAHHLAAAAEHAHRLGGGSTAAVGAIQTFELRRAQGRLREIDGPLQTLLALDRGNGLAGAWRPAIAVLLAELGRLEQLRDTLRLVRRDGLDAIAGPLLTPALVYLAEAVVPVDDAALAGELYERLEPQAGKIATLAGSVAYYGASDRYLGVLATTLGRFALADQHLVDAIALDEACGAVTCQAYALYERGRLAVRRGQQERAGAAFRAARALAVRHGLTGLLVQLDARERRAAAGAQGLSEREREVVALVVAGLSNREIGVRLHMSQHTAAAHVRSILRKTGCANRTQVAAWGRETEVAGSRPAPHPGRV
jgi:DNA-binding CsgD family transcriptional regulator/tetratricopeptide (TPR) repeat protein